MNKVTNFLLEKNVYRPIMTFYELHFSLMRKTGRGVFISVYLKTWMVQI